MNAFLGELGKKLAERWLTLLVLPGLLYVAVATAAGVLTHRNATDGNQLRNWLNTLVTAPASSSPIGVLAGAVGLLIGAAAAGLAAATLGQLTQRLWITPSRRPPAHWLIRWRQHRWNKAYKLYEESLKSAVHAEPSPPAGDNRDTTAALTACARISRVEPERPTWIADRLRATDERIHLTYRLDLSAAWPRLWLVIPETARSELSTADDSYAGAARLTGWALLYLLVGAFWWPALIIAVGTGVTGWIRGRAATDVLAILVEATVDLYGPDLARQLGITCPGPLTPEIGREITVAVRKDDTLPPQRH